MKRPPSILFLLLICLLTACLNEPDCVTTTTDFVNVRFYDLPENLPDTLRLDRLTVAGSDSVLAEMDTVISVRLPLNSQESRTTYYFDSQYGRDTLVLTYRLGTRLISEDCGVEVIYGNIGEAGHSFDSVRILNTVPVEEITEDIQVFN